MSAPARALVLDFDGTVVDSHAYTFAAIRHAAGPWAPGLVDADIHAQFGPAERVILGRWVPPPDVDAAYARLQSYYHEHAGDVRPHPRLRPLLVAARSAGIRCALFTGRAMDSTQMLLRALEFEALFDAVVAGDAPLRPKPAPDGVLALARRMGEQPADVLVVGDSPLDMAAARAAGARGVFAAWFPLTFVRAPDGFEVVTEPDALRRLLGLPLTAAGA